MAKSRSKKHSYSNIHLQHPDTVSGLSTRALPVTSRPKTPRRLTTPYLTTIQDLRSDPYEIKTTSPRSRFRTIDGRTAHVVHRTPERRTDTRNFVSNVLPAMHTYFQDHRRVIVCIRRRLRRAVLFALQKTGKGGSRRNRRPHWTEQSYIRCR